MRRRNKSLTDSHYRRGGFVLRRPVFVSGPAAAGPHPGRGCGQPRPSFSADTRLVPLNVTVTDKSGHLVTNLPQSAFQVFENGVLQQIKLFKREDVPVSMGLIIDNSGSMREKRQAVESAALALVRIPTRRTKSSSSISTMRPTSTADFTNDIKVMEQGLTKIDSRGGTAMRDAIRMSIDHLKEKAKRDKKVILVVTDGNDNASVMRSTHWSGLAQQDDVLIYAIGLLSEEEKREAKQGAARAGPAGREHGRRRSSIRRMSPKWSASPTRWPTISATSTPSPTRPPTPRWMAAIRQIKVTVKAPGNPVARTRSGYYATDKARAGSNRRGPRSHADKSSWRLLKATGCVPGDSPYLQWRIETWSGIEAATITPGMFLAFTGNIGRTVAVPEVGGRRTRAIFQAVGEGLVSVEAAGFDSVFDSDFDSPPEDFRILTPISPRPICVSRTSIRPI